jgi:GT2 family glycosyltransferase
MKPTNIMSSPRVSVIMPCFNAAAHLNEAVQSVLTQTYKDVELIIIDDGSTDDSPDLIAEVRNHEPQRILTLRQSNKGPYPARNLGLAHAKGDRVAFLDADDYWDTNFIKELSDAMDRSGAKLAYCGWQNVGIGGPGKQPYTPPDYCEEDVVLAFLRDCPWPIHAALVSRDVITRVGGFSERYFSSLDYDFWLRLMAVTHEMIRVPRVLAYYRWHGAGQISSNRPRQVIDAWKVRRDFVNDHPEEVRHLGGKATKALVNEPLRTAALDAFWRRDLATARTLLRAALFGRALKWTDLKYALPALLPQAAFDRATRLLANDKRN